MSALNWSDSLFSAEPKTEEIWKNWVKASTHTSQELTEIIYGEFQEEFQKRALFLLLVPDTRLAPFAWVNREPFHYLNAELNFQKVEAGLRTFAVYWLTKLINYTKQEASLSQLESFLSKTQQAAALNVYNDYILQLLAVLPIEDNQAETIFSYFSLNDITVWDEIKHVRTEYLEKSGYNPLARLWKNPQINEKWKKLAELEIRRIIKRELQGHIFPRAPWENALQCYARHLQSVLSIKPGHLPYGKNFLASQIEFLIALETPLLRLIQPEAVTLILNLLDKEGFPFTRRQFILFVVLCNGNFDVCDEQTEEIAQIMARDCHKEVWRLLNSKIENYRKTKEILAPMRKPPVFPPNENQSER